MSPNNRFHGKWATAHKQLSAVQRAAGSETNEHEEKKRARDQTLIDDASSVHPDYPRLVDLSLGRAMFRKYKGNKPWVVAQIAITRRHISAGALLRKFVVPFEM